MSSVVKMIENEDLEQWKREVGEQKAKEIAGRAANRGTWLHKMCEQYLLKDPTLNVPIVFQPQMRLLSSELDKITPIATEYRMWSKYLQVAGQSDCIGYYKGKLSIIDFKQSNREKDESDIHHYFAQEAAYAVSLEERHPKYGVPQLVTIMIVRGESSLRVFVQKRDDHIQRFLDAREAHRKLYTPPSEESFNAQICR